jgi:hypothetical protein
MRKIRRLSYETFGAPAKRGRAMLSRKISSEGIERTSGARSKSAHLSAKSSQIDFAASGRLVLIVVSPTRALSAMSSTPTIERSFGIDHPASRAACITPQAMLSSPQITAVGGSRSDAHFRNAFLPPSAPSSPK